MPRTSSRSSAKRLAGLLLTFEDELLRGRRVGVDPFAREAEVDVEHDESLLRPVVEVALDAMQLARLDVEDRRTAFLERFDLPAELTALGRAQEPGDDGAVEGQDELGQRRRDREERGAQQRSDDDDRAVMPGQRAEQSGEALAGHRVVPERHRQEPERQRPDARDDQELDHDQREVDRDVEHVPPPVLVGEFGAEELRRGRRGAVDTGGPAAARDSPAMTRRRSIRATSREPSIPSAMSSTPTPATRVANPADAMEMRMANAKTPRKKPRPMAAFAYQVAGWMGESRNARMGLRARLASSSGPAAPTVSGASAIPDEANDASPGIRAETSPARMRSSPTTRTAPPITARWTRVVRRSPPGGPRSRR